MSSNKKAIEASTNSLNVKSEESSSIQDANFAETNYISDNSGSKWGQFKDSFRRQQDLIDPNQSDAERAEVHEYKNEGEKLKKGISSRHMVMIAIATGIGTGLLVGSGTALNNGGPAGLLIGVILVGSMLVPTMEAAGEMALSYSNLTGGFNAYSGILVDTSFCFAVSWNYCIQWICVMPLELVTASITIKYWNSTINSDAFVVIFYVVIVVMNLIGSDGYAEFEFFLNVAKVLMIIGFSICAVVITCGGTGDGYIGAKYWYDPGAFAHSFKGVCAVFVSIAFALGCSESIAFNAAEQANPRRAIPSATKQIVYRIIILFIIPLFLVGLLVPYNDDNLLGSGAAATAASPFVIAVSTINVVPHIVNAVILLAVLSVGNSALFMSSRTLQCLAEQGMAPKFFNYVDRGGRPSRALAICAFFGLFSFIAAYDQEDVVFDWLLAISGLSTVLTWGGIVLSHIRFRAAMKAQGYSLSEMPYLAKTGTLGSWYSFVINVLILVAQFWIALWPVGGDGSPDANNFFQNYLGFIVALVFYIAHKLWTKNWRLFIPAEEIDLVRGRTIFDVDVLLQEEQADNERIKNSPFYYRWLRFWC